MDLESLLKIVSAIGDVAKTGNEVVSLINNVKKSLKNDNPTGLNTVQPGRTMNYNVPGMATFNSSMTNPYGHGNQWLPNLQAVASQNGNAWVPAETQPLLGIDLTGVWIIPSIMNYHVFFRQYGPYLNIVGVFAGMPVVFAEGLFDPTHRIIHLIGQNTYYGVSFETRGELFPNWTVQGTMSWMNEFGQPTQMPYFMQKVA